LNKKTIFVTGGAGFVGSHFIGKLMNSQTDIVVFDNLGLGSLQNIGRLAAELQLGGP